MDGDIHQLGPKDLDPEGYANYQRYEDAMKAKASGDLETAARLLEQSCNPPSIYSGHYRELFKIYRKKNREDLEAEAYPAVVHRVRQMIKYDEELIRAMLSYWGERQGRKLPPAHFDGSRNFKVTDAKALLRAGEALGDQAAIQEGRRCVRRFDRKA